MSTALPYISDHASRALGKMAQQFSRTGSVAGLISVEAARWQTLEDALYAFIAASDLPTAEGAELDVLGALVGQERGGLSDADFRLFIEARILSNRSSGTGEELLAIASLLNGTEAHFTPYAVASFELLLEGPTAYGPLIGQLVLAAEDAGVNGIFAWEEESPADTFTLDAGPGLDVGHLAGSMSL